jgi:hypothetical protein
MGYWKKLSPIGAQHRMALQRPFLSAIWPRINLRSPKDPNSKKEKIVKRVWFLLPILLLLNACASKPEPECTSCNSVVIAPPPGDASLKPFKPSK